MIRRVVVEEGVVVVAERSVDLELWVREVRLRRLGRGVQQRGGRARGGGGHFAREERLASDKDARLQMMRPVSTRGGAGLRERGGGGGEDGPRTGHARTSGRDSHNEGS